MKCSGCETKIRWWQKVYYYHYTFKDKQKKTNSNNWHYKCRLSWDSGYNTASKFANDECKLAGQKTPTELYWNRQGIKFKESGKPYIYICSRLDCKLTKPSSIKRRTLIKCLCGGTMIIHKNKED